MFPFHWKSHSSKCIFVPFIKNNIVKSGLFDSLWPSKSRTLRFDECDFQWNTPMTVFLKGSKFCSTSGEFTLNLVSWSWPQVFFINKKFSRMFARRFRFSSHFGSSFQPSLQFKVPRDSFSIFSLRLLPPPFLSLSFSLALSPQTLEHIHSLKRTHTHTPSWTVPHVWHS